MIGKGREKAKGEDFADERERYLGQLTLTA